MQWSSESGIPLARFGFAISAGDLNGDGYSDVAIGAPRAMARPEASPNGGRVVLLSGSNSGLGLSTQWTAQSDRPGTLLGRALTFVPGITGPGTRHFLVGAPFRRTEFDGEGAAYLLTINGSGETAFGNPGLRGKSANLLFGSALCPAGDLNGDGFEDVAIGAFRATYSLHREGGVFFYPGSADGLVVKDPRWFWVGRQSEAFCGWAMVAAGDMNQDGYDDVLVGMPGHDSDQRDAGRVCLVLGSAKGPQLEPGWVADGPQAYVEFGSALAVGDVNNDGINDAIIGAPGSDRFPGIVGGVFIYLGTTNGFERAPAYVWSDRQPGSGFGFSVAYIRDVNGDQRPELLIGAPRYDAAHADEGRVTLYPGTRDGPVTTPDWMVLGGQPGAACGHAVADAGDVNGDGFGDFLIGSSSYRGRHEREGRVDLFFGARNTYGRLNHFPSDETNSVFQPYDYPEDDMLATVTASLTHSASRAWRLPGLIMLAVVLGAGWFWFHRYRLKMERLRIARDLHDQVGPHLARLAQVPSPNSTSPADGTSHVPDASSAAQAVARALEQAVWTVHPQHDTLDSLNSFLGSQAERYFHGTGVRCFFDLPDALPPLRLGSEWRKNVLLCAQEAFANVLKHAHASEVHLRIGLEGRQLTIEIEDNGRGLPANPGRQFGNGLSNMRARVELLGGSLCTERPDGGGVRVSLVIPL